MDADTTTTEDVAVENDDIATLKDTITILRQQRDANADAIVSLSTKLLAADRLNAQRAATTAAYYSETINLIQERLKKSSNTTTEIAPLEEHFARKDDLNALFQFLKNPANRDWLLGFLCVVLAALFIFMLIPMMTHGR